MTQPMRVFKHHRMDKFILESLIEYIRESGLKAGDKLPSQVEMAQRMNVSRTSLREAIAQLEARGVLKQIQGIGTLVALNPDEYQTTISMETSITEMITAMGKTPGTSEVILEWRALPAEFEGAFGEGEKFICLQRTRTANGEPFAVSISYLAPWLIQSPDEIQIHKHNESLFKFLEEYCGEIPVYFDDQIEIVFPEREIAERLKIVPTQPIFKFNRRQHNQEHKLLVVSSDYFNLKSLSLKVTRHSILHEIEKQY